MKSNRTIAILLVLLVVVILTFSSCDDGLVHFKTEKYGMTEVLCWFDLDSLVGFTVNGEYWDEDSYVPEKEMSTSYVYFVGLNKNKDKEIALIFDSETGNKICESEWVFDVSFRDMFDMLNAWAGEDIYPKYHNCYMEVLNSLANKEKMLKLVPQIEDMALDVPLMLHYVFEESAYANHDYAIVQSNGEILIFDIESAENQ